MVSWTSRFGKISGDVVMCMHTCTAVHRTRVRNESACHAVSISCPETDAACDAMPTEINNVDHYLRWAHWLAIRSETDRVMIKTLDGHRRSDRWRRHRAQWQAFMWPRERRIERQALACQDSMISISYRSRFVFEPSMILVLLRIIWVPVWLRRYLTHILANYNFLNNCKPNRSSASCPQR